MAGGLDAGTAQAAQGGTAREEAAQVYIFVPIRLTVHDIEDGWPDSADEPRMYYGDAVWADVVQRGGQITTIDPVDFTGTSLSVDLWERDAGWTDNNHLGHDTATISQLDQELEMTFKGDWWDYELKYKVVKGPAQSVVSTSAGAMTTVGALRVKSPSASGDVPRDTTRTRSAAQAPYVV
ncbi:hypothetical protein [Streptomyces sp. 8N616]|uniref:hypothetical protein n=1 Tax=Streptomyces sp. 8N616 TaxID=3457414 RepID=UPI003FCEF65E